MIFVHGLRGDKERTWQSSGKKAVFWPRWLESDLPGVAVWSVGYAAPATRWGGSAMYLPDAAENVLARMASEPRFRIGNIAFVAHSLGGLVVKQLIRHAERDASRDEVRASLLERIRKVAFLATPHSGADLASVANFLSAVIRPSEACAGLGRNDPHLLDLNRWYRIYATDNGIETLVLYETRPTKIVGYVVKPDSSDPGMPNARIIPIEADHETIAKPADKSSEVYVHLRDFLERPSSKAHTRVQVASALQQLEATVTRENERVLSKLNEALAQEDSRVRSTSSSLADSEAAKRLSALRRSRFFIGFDVRAQARRLAEEMATGELASASTLIKVETLAWCARFLAQGPTTAAAEKILDAPLMARDTVEVQVARAFVNAARGDYAAALDALSKMTGRLARTASLFIAAQERTAEHAIQWFENAIGSIADLDPDGKFLLLRRYLSSGRWDDALYTANSLSEEDFGHTPALFHTAALAHLAQAVAEELRPLLLKGVPFNTYKFPLAADGESLSHRRRAQDLFARGAEAAAELDCHRAANVSADLSLWLGLRDPDRHSSARKLLERSMSESAHALRRLPLALECGLKLDLTAVERELDRVSALSGGRSTDAAVARLAMAMTKDTEGEVADYIARHRSQLNEYYGAEAIAAMEVEMLARSRRSADAEARLAELEAAGANPDTVAALRLMIVEAKGADPVPERIRRYGETRQITDLLTLVHLLEERRDWKRLIEFGEILFQRTRDLPHAELLVRALTEQEDDERLVRLFESYPEILAQSDALVAAYAWALYRLGTVKQAASFLTQLRAKRDNAKDRALLVSVAIASGEWRSLLAFVEQEWENRGKRTAEEIVGVAQLAQHIDSPRTPDLIREAVAKAPDNPTVLITCYSIATSTGQDHDQEVVSWLQKAAELSGEDGPVQKVSLQELVARQPDWQRHESETWNQLSEGRLPLFGAAYLLNRSLADMYLRTALTNGSQRDVRRRGVVLTYSGARPPAQGVYDSIALDPTALLTLGLLGITDRVLRAFTRVFIPHSTLQWLFEERQRLKFHQPSRVKQARELHLLLGGRALHRFEPSTKGDSDLAAEIGEDLAAMIAEAEAKSDDDRQRVVVRPFPVLRVGSLMEEPADLSNHARVLCSCSDVVDALKRLGHITAAEETRARAYLQLHEQRWPHETVLEEGAVLYLDDLALTYLHHVDLLSKLAAAQFVPIVSENRIEEAQQLVLYDAVAEKAGSILEEIRRCLSEGIKTGVVRLGRASPRNEANPRLRRDPTIEIFSLASEADALIIDDRSVNRHLNVDFGSGLCPILTTLDLLGILHSRGALDSSELAESRAKLRSAGLALIPVDSAELISLLEACSVKDGILSETAELRSVRESALRIRMTNIVQLPQEQLWLNGLLRAWIDALRAQWIESVDEEIAVARSNWLLQFVDLKGWLHRYPEGGASSLWADQYRTQLMVLMTIGFDQPRPVRSAYWKWLERAVLTDMKRHDRKTFSELVERARKLFDEFVEGVAN